MDEADNRLVEQKYSEYRRDLESLSNKISVTISNLAKTGLIESERKKLLATLEAEEEGYTSLLNRIRTPSLEILLESSPR